MLRKVYLLIDCFEMLQCYMLVVEVCIVTKPLANLMAKLVTHHIHKQAVFTDNSFTKCPRAHEVISFLQSCV